MSWGQTSKIQHPDDVREALGFRGEPGGHDLLHLYRRAANQMHEPYNRGDLRVAYLIAQDPYYWRTFKKTQSLQVLIDAGFFDDGLEPGALAKTADLQFLSTPLEHVRQRVLELECAGKIHDKKLVVLLTTGCFAPIHIGHVKMMQRAREAMEERGYEVVGGYFSPSHDDYVATKGEEARRLTIDYRSQIINKVLEDSDWLELDAWEARYAPTDINFTSVVDRLKHYINTHIETPVDIEIAYVFGADNIQFARAFTEKGLAVCVARPGNEARVSTFIEKSGLADNPNIVFAESTDTDISSTKVRSGAVAAFDRLSGDAAYERMIKGEARRHTQEKEQPQALYLVRDDLQWALEPWASKIDPQALQEAIANFRSGLVRAIENAFERTRAPGYPKRVEAILLSVDDQMDTVRDIMSICPEKVINNDIITGGDNNAVGLSRLFSLSSGQTYSRTLVPRPGRENLQQLMGRLAKGGRIMIDDDIATGTTMRLIEAKLPEGVQFEDKISLSEIVFRKNCPDRNYEFWDIVDARDFLLGSRSGGLVVQLFNGAVGRAPYILPYTSLVTRAKIPPDQEMALSAEILRLNRRFLRDIWADIQVADTDPQFQKLMQSVGFRGRMNMDDVCAWHHKFIG